MLLTRDKTMDTENIEELRRRLTKKYKGTFSQNTEKLLEEFDDNYNVSCVNCAFSILQKSQEVSARILNFFREVPYSEYQMLYEHPAFLAKKGNIVSFIKEELLDLLIGIGKAYKRIGSDVVVIDFSAIKKFNIPAYLTNTNSSYLIMPVVLNKASLDFFYLILDLVDEEKNKNPVTMEIKLKSLSGVLIAAQGLYNLLFSFDDEEDSEDEDNDDDE